MQIQELLNTLLVTLQSLVVLLSAQNINTPEIQQTLNQATQLLNNQKSQVFTITKTTSPPTTFTTINETKANAVVNILCRAQSPLRGGSASGVIISPNGLLLTNAHMAQYLLLEQQTDAHIQCTIRSGAPAKNSYKAEVLYISPFWINKNAKQITKSIQYGTGEGDYALLQLKPLNKENDIKNDLSKQDLTYLTPNTSWNNLKKNQKVLIRAYPSEMLGYNIILRNLYPTATIANITELSTFSNPDLGETLTPDLISLGGSIVAQGGSSGGAVINQYGELVGIVVTSTRDDNTKDRTLRAITLPYINSNLKKNTGKTLQNITNTDTDTLKKTFNTSLIRSAGVLSTYINK